MRSERVNILFAGGGTGGHLFPALAIADEIRRLRPEARITFVGTRKKIEARVVPARGYDFVSIWISGIRRTLSAGNLLFPLKVVVSMLQSFFLLQRLKPGAVVGTGGYVCGPVVYVASLLRVPTLIQEQNSYPGITTRFLSPRVDRVHITFEGTRKYLGRTDNVIVSGNPTSPALRGVTREEGVRFFGLDPSKMVLLVFGGSLGASSINSALGRIVSELRELSLQIIWQTGDKDYDRILADTEVLTGRNPGPRIVVRKFIDRMDLAYAASDLAVCRSGATTVAELASVGLPAILVPYPFAAADHQTENARALVEGDAAVMIKDHELNEKLLPTITELVTDLDRRRHMSDRVRKMGKPDAATVLAQSVLEMVK